MLLRITPTCALAAVVYDAYYVSVRLALWQQSSMVYITFQYDLRFGSICLLCEGENKFREGLPTSSAERDAAERDATERDATRRRSTRGQSSRDRVLGDRVLGDRVLGDRVSVIEY